MNQLEADLERILRVQKADLGLFILAMHSLMEKHLAQKFGKKGYDSEDGFDSLMKRYAEDYEYKHIDFNLHYITDKNARNLYKSLKEIRKNHFLANDVRHQFAEKSPEDAQTTISCFLAFAKAENWGNLRALNELQRELENWDNHNSYQSEEFKRAIAQIERLKKENENLAQKANDYSDLQKKLAEIELNERYLKSELAEKQARLLKKDARLDEIRQKNNEQAQEFRKQKEEILKKLQDYETTQQYLTYLEKIAFYTKTRRDYEASVIKLTPEQNEILEQIRLDKDFLIKGAAGTGKSLVLLKALEKAVRNLKEELNFENSQNNFRLLTYTKSLVKYNRYVTKILGTEVPEDAITRADSFLTSMLRKFFPAKKITYSREDIPTSVFDDSNFTPDEIYNECSEFIWANCITKEDYVDKVCDREGMKNPLKKADREKMWQALEKVEERLENSTFWPRNFVAKKVLSAMDEALKSGKNDFLSEYSFIDEAQDLPPVLLAVIKKSTRRCVFLAGDSNQSIYRKGFNWKLSGIDIVGRTKILKTNFRNTNQIHEFAEKYRAKFKHIDKTTQPLAFRPGPPVEHTVIKKKEDVFKPVIQETKMLLDILAYEEENICIIANENSKLKEIKKRLGDELGVDAVLVSEDSFDFAATKGIRLCTMQNCKGLDFPVVLLLADHRVHSIEQNTAFDSETFYEQQYNMIYVCLTRAMEMLHIFTCENSDFAPFKDLSL